ncbi:reverse transcriptase domain-containing protein, partial [Bradyrhizobium sp. CCBAU 45321]|uniref:reverse transcriptase domain-containing protein n=1 Tax=Bradyrhizobium sp. CCBAU 45321 TaxID=1641878 RepID=UPI00230342EE
NRLEPSDEGRAPPHRLQMGLALPAKVAGSAREHAGWKLGQAHKRNSAGVNLFLHYAFDLWMSREYPDVPFERYADDAIGHCRSEAEARDLCRALEARFAECGLRLHPEKTKIVSCKDANRSGAYPEQAFDFLGYSFRPRMANNRHGERFVSFSPAVSKKAGKRMRHTVRRWRLHRRSDLGWWKSPNGSVQS